MSGQYVRIARIATVGLLAVAAAALLLPGTAAAIPLPPAAVTSITLDPALPDGRLGWWVTNPFVAVLSDQDGVAHWSWDGGAESTAAVTAGVPWVVGIAPDGLHGVTAYTVGLSATPGGSVSVTIPSDPIAPDQVPGVTGTIAPALGIDLSWGAATDTISGVAGYLIYRSTTNIFTPTDLIGTTTSLSWRDNPVPPGFYWYAVSAVDVAGNESVLSEPMLFASDVFPPTTPGHLQAWRGVGGFARVTWTPSTDVGFGMDHYVLLRSVGGGAYSVLTTLAPDVVLYDDHDPVVTGQVAVSYKLYAVDKAGLRSGDAGPATLGVDTTPPAVPTVSARLVFDAPGSTFALDWTPAGVPAGSEIATYELAYGPVGSTPVTLTIAGYPAASTRTIATSSPAALYSFSVRAMDRAGNVSAFCTPVLARNVTVRRVFGSDRYETAVALSASTFATSGAVVVASGRIFTDAAAASGLAGVLKAPILLVPAGPAPASVVAEIVRLGAKKVYVIGGEATVPSSTVGSLSLPGVTVQRVAGPDRYSTAAQVAQLIGSITGAPSRRVYLVSGRVFSDAVTAASAAYAEGVPVLFGARMGLRPETVNAVATSGASETVVVGGTGSVTADAERLLPGVVRIGGADRYVVNRAFADWAIAGGVLTGREPAVASGVIFTDGVAAAPFAGERRSPVLLDDPLGASPVAPWLASQRASLLKVTVAGGPARVSEAERFALWGAVSAP